MELSWKIKWKITKLENLVENLRVKIEEAQCHESIARERVEMLVRELNAKIADLDAVCNENGLKSDCI